MKNLLALLLLCAATFCFSQTAVKNVDAQTFKHYIDENKGVLIDLRTSDEITKKGMIKGATQLDFFDKSAEANIEKLDRKQTYLIYCAGGGRSSDCADMMQKMGFVSVINLEAGYDDWKRKGFETVKR